MKHYEKQEIILKSGNSLLVLGKPGIGKTAILEWIAEKNDWEYYDFRLSQINPEDFKGIPRVDKDGYVIDAYRIEWKNIINTLESGKDVLLVLEELNRARQEIQNTALSLINEKRIGSIDFREMMKEKGCGKLYIAATGNLGMDDDTIVEDWDRATRTRFITMLFNKPNIDEWAEWARRTEEVLPEIVEYLHAHPSYLDEVFASEKSYEEVVLSPRTWHQWSKTLEVLVENNADEDTIREMSIMHLGSVGMKFVEYLKSRTVIKPKDVLDSFDKFEKKINAMDRGTMEDLLQQVIHAAGADEKKSNVTAKQAKNFVKFIILLEDDKIAGMWDQIKNGTILKECRKNDRIMKIANEIFNR